MHKMKVFSAAIIAMICWALSFVWVKVAYESFTPITLVLFRLFGASVLMIIYGVISRRLQAIKHGDVRLFLALAFFEPFLYFMAESFGMQKVSSTLGAVIISTIPLFAPIIAWFFSKEKVSIINAIGIAISLSGVFFIVYDFEYGFTASGIGIFLMLIAVFAAIFYSVFLKKLTHQYTVTTIIAYQSLIGFIYFLPFFLVFELPDFEWNSFSTKSIYATLQLTIFASVMAFILFTYAIKHIGITKANAFVNLIPAITYIFSILFLNEEVKFGKISGILVVILGLFLCQLKLKKRIA